MRINEQQQQHIKQLVSDIFDANSSVILFGSRADDNQRGGDLDLMIESPVEVDNPALLTATLAARVSRLMAGRRVDVLLAAPNLKKLPIHEAARSSGIRL